MPRYEQPVPLFKDETTSLAVALQAFKNLGWKAEFAGENGISGAVPGTWKNKAALVCLVKDGQLLVSSESVNNETFDLFGRNKKYTNQFIAAFTAAQSIDEAAIQENKQAVEDLKIHTSKQLEEEAKNTEELNRALNLSGSNLYLTYTIIGINVLVFILMAINGAGIMAPDGLVHIAWGSNFSPLTLSGDWWRLLTNVFIHFGIIHLLMNMYCLYSISIYLEPMLGKMKFILAYLCTGIFASIVSLWWHKDGINSAGASGAIFGMYGLFLAFLTSKLVPSSVRKQLLQSIGIFVFYNLVYGLKKGVDNAAHAGGLISGFIIGWCLVPVIKKEREQQSMPLIPVVIAVTTVIVSFLFLQQSAVPLQQRAKILQELKDEGYKDGERFNDKLGEFDKLHEQVQHIMSDTTLTDEQLLKKIDEEVSPALTKAGLLMQQTASFDISPAAHEKAGKLIEYVDLRKQEMDIIRQIVSENKAGELMPVLIENRTKSNALFSAIVGSKQ